MLIEVLVQVDPTQTEGGYLLLDREVDAPAVLRSCHRAVLRLSAGVSEHKVRCIARYRLLDLLLSSHVPSIQQPRQSARHQLQMILHLLTTQPSTTSSYTLHHFSRSPFLRLNMVTTLPEGLHKHRGQHGHQLGHMAPILSQKPAIGSQNKIYGRGKTYQLARSSLANE